MSSRQRPAMPRRYHFFPLVTLLLCLFASAVRAETDVDPERFEKRLLVPRTHDPMQLELLPDGSFLFIERGGAIKRAIRELAEAGRIHPAVGAQLPLSQWRTGFEAMAKRELVGKVVFEPGD